MEADLGFGRGGEGGDAAAGLRGGDVEGGAVHREDELVVGGSLAADDFAFDFDGHGGGAAVGGLGENDELPGGPFDFSWCRWVLCFVSDPNLLVKKISNLLRPGGRAIFHEYGHYMTWQFVPPRASHEEFRNHVVATWRGSGGDPDTGLQLPKWLKNNGFAVCSMVPRIFCLRPSDYMWQWPSQFIQVHLLRLLELGEIDPAFADRVRSELAAAEREDHSFMLTPLVLEIVAEKGPSRTGP